MQRFDLPDLLVAAALAPLLLALSAISLPPQQQLPVLLAGVIACTLAVHDARTGYLPDIGTLGLLWLGLLLSGNSRAAIFGAAWGYVVLWLLGHLYRWARGRHGMGYGDYKLLAAAGAWVGAAALPWLILLACISTLAWTALRRVPLDSPTAFGPHLALGLLALLLWQGPL
ncbi:MAG: prepilin peptidase [Gammaproteobacteria bacterium AqS3]|nr:prepilin peptidase [Gammaproteobacteria bacterium AqS3]